MSVESIFETLIVPVVLPSIHHRFNLRLFGDVHRHSPLCGLMLIRFNVHFANTRKQQHIDVVANHGLAGGRLPGASANQVDRLRRLFPLADIYIMGHDHKRLAQEEVVLDFIESPKKGLVPIQKVQWLCRSASFAKSFEKGQVSYAVPRLYTPSAIGGLELSIGFSRLTRERLDTLRPDIKPVY